MHPAHKTQNLVVRLPLRDLLSHLRDRAREFDTENFACTSWWWVPALSLGNIHAIETESFNLAGNNFEISIIPPTILRREIELTLTRTSLADGVGVGASPMKRSSIPPAPPLTNTARIWDIFEYARS